MVDIVASEFKNSSRSNNDQRKSCQHTTTGKRFVIRTMDSDWLTVSCKSYALQQQQMILFINEFQVPILCEQWVQIWKFLMRQSKWIFHSDHSVTPFLWALMLMQNQPVRGLGHADGCVVSRTKNPVTHASQCLREQNTVERNPLATSGLRAIVDNCIFLSVYSQGEKQNDDLCGSRQSAEQIGEQSVFSRFDWWLYELPAVLILDPGNTMRRKMAINSGNIGPPTSVFHIQEPRSSVAADFFCSLK